MANYLRKSMELLISILSTIFIIFGIGLIFSPARGSTIAAVITILAGVIAIDDKSFIPLIIGFGLLWVLRIVGVEQR